MHRRLQMKADWGLFCRNKSSRGRFGSFWTHHFGDSQKTAALHDPTISWEYWAFSFWWRQMNHRTQVCWHVEHAVGGEGLLFSHTEVPRLADVGCLESPLHHGQLVTLQVVLLTRKESAIHVPWGLDSFPRKRFEIADIWDWGRSVFAFFSLYTKKKKKKVSKIKLENICSIYFLIVKGSAISWLFPSPLMTNLWELNVLWAIRQDGKDKGRYNLKKPLYGSLWGKCFKDWENRNWGRVIK